MNEQQKKSGYLALCYHYIRSAETARRFPRILGNREDLFLDQIKMLEKNFEIISPKQALDFSYGRFRPAEKTGLLITFDDGLSDHYLAAKILKERQIKGLFFIPTCILIDNLPANPVIIHYILAVYGIAGFLKEYNKVRASMGLENQEINPKNGKNQWEIIARIKTEFKYELDHKTAREILLCIYKASMLKDYPDAMKVMHLSHRQVVEILEMGHSIGVHTHSHLSVGASKLNTEEINREIIFPQKYLEEIFQTEVSAFSYPFGEEKDCLTTEKLLKIGGGYRLAFTIEKILNTPHTSPFQLGRYMPTGQETDSTLKRVLADIAERGQL